VPTSIRSSGVPVTHGPVSELGSILDAWLAAHADGTACVIGDPSLRALSPDGRRVRTLTPQLCKGLEFDLVVLVDAGPFDKGGFSDGGIERAVDRYVAMTRATQRLVILAGS